MSGVEIPKNMLLAHASVITNGDWCRKQSQDVTWWC